MRRRTVLAFTLLSACGPQQAESTTGATTATSTGDGTGPAPTTGEPGTGQAPTTGADPTGDGTTSAATGTTNPAATTGGPTGDATTGDVTTGVGTTDGDTSTTGGDASTTSTGDETAAPAELVTKAWWVDGAESLQIRIIQADPDAGLCRGVWLTILDLGPNGFDPVEPPAPWHVRDIWVHQNLDDCFDPYEWYLNGPSWADGATGTVVFHDLDDQGKPATIDIDVTGHTYSPEQVWVPAEDPLTASALPVVVG